MVGVFGGTQITAALGLGEEAWKGHFCFIFLSSCLIATFTLDQIKPTFGSAKWKVQSVHASAWNAKGMHGHWNELHIPFLPLKSFVSCGQHDVEFLLLLDTQLEHDLIKLHKWRHINLRHSDASNLLKCLYISKDTSSGWCHALLFCIEIFTSHLTWGNERWSWSAISPLKLASHRALKQSH